MCSSLYMPNEKLISLYHKLEVSRLKSVKTVDTVSLDQFISTNNIGSVDFIKIDIQGAELDVFTGGRNTLRDVVGIVTEVEFITLYLGQPLFGDVCAFLTGQGFMFHKFLGLSGRALKPIVMQQNPGFACQHMWSDAVFIKNITKLDELSSEMLLKMSILNFMYGSPDVVFQCLRHYDNKNGTSIISQFMKMGSKPN